MSLPTVAIVLLNYRGGDDTIACLDSLQGLDYPNVRIIVVDNNSGDGSFERIQCAHPRGIQLIQSGENLGFSGGNNIGIRAALEESEIRYIWLLNNDTLVHPEALMALVHQAQKQPRSLVGSVIRYPDGRFQRIGNRLNRLRGGLQSYSESDLQDGQVVESLSGCSMLLPREVFESIGLLSEEYFLYFEDNDFCLRASHAGFQSIITLKSLVFHKEGSSTGGKSPLVTYYYQRNRLILARKFFTRLQFKSVQLYTRYRLFRSTIKSVSQNHPETKSHHRAFQLAIDDFSRGIQGKCPHSI